MIEEGDGYIEKKVYPISVREAKKKLEILKPFIKSMKTDFQKYIETESELTELSKCGEIQTISKVRFELDLIEDRLRHLQLVFLENNCVVKDMGIGLIDFIALRNNEPVWLCFKDGEENLSYFHEWNTGYAGRKLIDFE